MVVQVHPPQTVKQGASYTLSSVIPVRDGYTFLGWARDPNATSPEVKAGQITLVASYGGYTHPDETLYAVWSK